MEGQIETNSSGKSNNKECKENIGKTIKNKRKIRDNKKQ